MSALPLKPTCRSAKSDSPGFQELRFQEVFPTGYPDGPSCHGFPIMYDAGRGRRENQSSRQVRRELHSEGHGRVFTAPLRVDVAAHARKHSACPLDCLESWNFNSTLLEAGPHSLDAEHLL